MEANGRFLTAPFLSDYALTDTVLGTGCNGPVVQVKRHNSDALFALKCLPDNPKGRREVQLHLQCCASPWIVRVEAVYENVWQGSAQLLLVMELLSGGDLFSHIQNKTQNGEHFSEREAREIVRQMCGAVQFLHSQNIAHRDLKPENFMFVDVSATQLKMIDFGFAKQQALRTPVFTPYYAAPEVLRARTHSHEVYDMACDMWSLGVIVYIILCGSPPFYSYSQQQDTLSPGMERRIRAAAYDFDDELWTPVSPQAKDLVRKLLVADPLSRLTVRECLVHPWLTAPTDAVPTATLPTPAALGSQPDMWREARSELASTLAHMRVEESSSVGPLTLTGNALLARRTGKTPPS